MSTLFDLLKSEPFELVLSSGFFGFFAHTGVVAALEEAGLVPSRIGGSSAGALIAGLWGAGVPAAQIRSELFGLTRGDFWDADPTLGLGFYLKEGGSAERLRSLLPRLLSDSLQQGEPTGAGLLRGAAFDALLRRSLDPLGVSRFEHCRVPVRVAAFELMSLRTHVIESGELAPAIRASCSFPGMFQPVRIGAARYLDGGIADRPGISTATPGTRLLFHHLPTHSPWRRLWRGQNHIPRWPEMYLLHEPRLPRLSPFKLGPGPSAYSLAREMTLRTLHAPPSRYSRSE